MASTIKLKNGSGAPLAGDLVQAEPALDLTNKRLYTEDSLGNVIEVGINPSSLTIGGTALTATAAELNTLDGITATTAELNTLDGITATVTELNYTDGVTSNIQTQLNTKAPIASPTFTGTVTAPAVNVNGTVTADGLLVDGVGRILESGAAARFVVARTDGLNSAESASIDLMENSTSSAMFGEANAYGFRIENDGSANQLNIKSGVQTLTNNRMSIDRDTGDISFYEDTGTTAKFFWDASTESLGIGTTSLVYPLEVAKASAAGLLVKNTDAASLSGMLLYNGSSVNQIYSWGATSTTDKPLAFLTGNTERARIDSSGNLLVGTTNASQALNTVTANTGIALRANNTLQISRNGGSVAYFNRLTSDGAVAEFLKDGTTVGSIGTASGGWLYSGALDTALLYDNGANSIQPYQPNTSSLRDNAVDLGGSSARFRNLYLSGGVYLGGTGAANLLDDYEEGTFTPVVEGTTTAGTATYITRVGKYTKVGNMVHVNIYVDWSGHTGTGKLIITGLPFNSITQTGVSFGSLNGLVKPADTMVGGFTNYNSDTIRLFSVSTSGTTATNVDLDIDAAALVNVSITYRID